MNKETMLLNAAKAMGFNEVDTTPTGYVWHTKNGKDELWNPLGSSADCAVMEDALEIDIAWDGERKSEPNVTYTGFEAGVSAMSEGWDGSFPEVVALFKDHANKGAARRYASTMVAAMIGSKM